MQGTIRAIGQTQDTEGHEFIWVLADLDDGQGNRATQGVVMPAAGIENSQQLQERLAREYQAGVAAGWQQNEILSQLAGQEFNF